MTLSLFPTAQPDEREAELRDIFTSWIHHRARSGSKARHERALKEESATVYQEMWHAFAAYCAGKDLEINTISGSDIRAFLLLRGSGQSDNARVMPKGDNLSPRYAWRMLTLIDRLTRFHADRKGIVANTAAQDLLQLPEYRYANASHRDPLPEHFSEQQAEQLIAFLTSEEDHQPDTPPSSWKTVRDRTAIALMLGAGLAPGDVRAIQLSGVIVDGGHSSGLPWKLALPGNGNAPARETPVADWAGRQLAYWLDVRSKLEIPGPLVFPSTSGGKAWSHTGCYEACRAVLESAGLKGDSGGVFKLRHTFALRQLGDGRSDEEVARWLGLLDVNSMSRYRRIVPHTVDIV